MERLLGELADRDRLQTESSARAEACMVQACNGSHHFTIVPVKGEGPPPCTSSGANSETPVPEAIGFGVMGKIVSFPEKLQAAIATQSVIQVEFVAFGRKWHLEICQDHIGLRLSTGPALTRTLWTLKLGETQGAAICRRSRHTRLIAPGNTSRWDLTGREAGRIAHPSLVSLDGSLAFAMTLTFAA